MFLPCFRVEFVLFIIRYKIIVNLKLMNRKNKIYFYIHLYVICLVEFQVSTMLPQLLKLRKLSVLQFCSSAHTKYGLFCLHVATILYRRMQNLQKDHCCKGEANITSKKEETCSVIETKSK